MTDSIGTSTSGLPYESARSMPNLRPFPRVSMRAEMVAPSSPRSHGQRLSGNGDRLELLRARIDKLNDESSRQSARFDIPEPQQLMVNSPFGRHQLGNGLGSGGAAWSASGSRGARSIGRHPIEPERKFTFGDSLDEAAGAAQLPPQPAGLGGSIFTWERRQAASGTRQRSFEPMQPMSGRQQASAGGQLPGSGETAAEGSADGQKQAAGGHTDASWQLEPLVFINGWRSRPDLHVLECGRCARTEDGNTSD